MGLLQLFWSLLPWVKPRVCFCNRIIKDLDSDLGDPFVRWHFSRCLPVNVICVIYKTAISVRKWLILRSMETPLSLYIIYFIIWLIYLKLGNNFIIYFSLLVSHLNHISTRWARKIVNDTNLWHNQFKDSWINCLILVKYNGWLLSHLNCAHILHYGKVFRSR